MPMYASCMPYAVNDDPTCVMNSRVSTRPGLQPGSTSSPVSTQLPLSVCVEPQTFGVPPPPQVCGRVPVARFGEMYAFSPTFVAIRRDEPTEISFWNLQPDDDHDFMLVDPDANVLMKVLLPALRKTTYGFTFRGEGLFTVYC